MALTGCGSDDEPATTTKAPQLTVPGETASEPAQTQPQPQTTAPPATGTTTTNTTPTHTSTQPDPNTPEGRFDQFCRENPGACG